MFSRHFELGIALNYPGTGEMSQACGPVDAEFAGELMPGCFNGFDADARAVEHRVNGWFAALACNARVDARSSMGGIDLGWEIVTSANGVFFIKMDF